MKAITSKSYRTWRRASQNSCCTGRNQFPWNIYFVKMLRQLKFLSFCWLSCVIVCEANTFNRCYSCRGINCLKTSAQNTTETCADKLDVCVTIFDKFTVVANGCFLTMPQEFQDKCNEKVNPECQMCFYNSCNNLGREDFKCYECNDMEDPNCSKNVSALTPVQCKIPTSPNSFCFTEKSSDGQVRRGCALHLKDQKACLASNSCQLCSVADRQACNVVDINASSVGFRKETVVVLLMISMSIVSSL